MVIAICIGIIYSQVNTIDGPTKLVRQDAILGGLSIGQFNNCLNQHLYDKNSVDLPDCQCGRVEDN